jgi:flavin reductase (DIM6/NTAB) family NADH-FMN oxidoreductase RutF
MRTERRLQARDHLRGAAHSRGDGYVTVPKLVDIRPAAPVAVGEFRETMSRVPGPVTVVTTNGADGPHGTTVSAFCALSADPPLVLVALDRSSDLLRLLRQSRRFAVNLLATGQEWLGEACARKGPDKLRLLPWHQDEDLPRIDGAAAWLACEIEELVPGGDHVIVTGLVTQCETNDSQALVYHRRQFLSLA